MSGVSNAKWTDGRPSQPGKVQAIAVMTLVGGILAAVLAVMNLLLTLAFCFTLLFAVYQIVLAVLAIIKGARLLGNAAHMETPPVATAIMQIINIISCDVVNLVLGILILVFLSDPEVKSYFRTNG